MSDLSKDSGLDLSTRPLPKVLIDRMALDPFYLKMAWPRIGDLIADSIDHAAMEAIKKASMERAKVYRSTILLTTSDRQSHSSAL